jgi:FtsZ-binding cell division protein ZapB
VRTLKPETEIRNLKRDLARARREATDLRLRYAALGERAFKIGVEAEDWKRRFDALLARLDTRDG